MKLFLLEHNSVFQDIKREFEVVSKIEDADKVILWNDVNPLERSICALAKSLGKETIVYQHGRRGSSRYYPPFNEPITADKYFAWGEKDKQDLIGAGHPADKIFVVGTTIFSHLKPRESNGRKPTVVFCPEHWDRPVEENIRVRDELRKLRGVNLMTKLIESHNLFDFDKPVKSNREEDSHLDICGDVLRHADIVVGVSESTFELMAQYLDIPVVIMSEWEPKAFGGDMRYTQYTRRIISRASKQTTAERLVETVIDQLRAREELKIARREVCVEEGGVGLNCIDEIKKCLNH